MVMYAAFEQLKQTLGVLHGMIVFRCIWLQVKMRGPDQPPKPTGDPDPRSRPAIQTDPDLTIQTYDPDPFVLSSLDIFFYKVLKSITLHYKVLVLLQYHSALQSATKY